MTFAILLLLPCIAHAAEPLSVDMLGRIPVQQDGRIKPLEQFARVTLRQLSGAESLKEIEALPWLMELLFTPEIAAERPIFTIKEDSLRASMNLPERPGHRYAAKELATPLTEKRPLVMPIVMMPAKERSPEQQALMDLYQRFSLFTDLQQSFAILLPLNAPRPAGYDLPTPLTYLDLQRIRETLLADAEAIAKRSHGDLDALSAPEREVVALAFLTERLEQQALQSRSFRVMPGTWEQAGSEWFAPWALLRAGYGSPQSGEYLKRWKAAALAYRDSDAEAWASASTALANAGEGQAHGMAALRLGVEYWYVVLAPLNWVLGLLLASVALLLTPSPVGGGSGWGREGTFDDSSAPHPSTLARVDPTLLGEGHWDLRAALAKITRPLLLLALTLLTLTLAARIFILARPPVGTLYESLLFVAWAGLAVCVLPTHAARRTRGVGAGLAALLLIIAPVFASDETMGMLTAVLNTDFWLTVHVLCITSGYAACLLAGGMAHAELFRQARAEAPLLVTRPLTLYTLAALGLTATGTLLGGVWADQSWGRFWGWDPKENGALLIVLWIIWLLHARQAGQLSVLGYVAAIALLTVVVALAWFGVNMLGIGLHSYGFTEATAAGLAGFCLVEFVLVFGLCYRIRRRGYSA
jgi:ABC-type transport system involved in cytochrome c biogenesis permease subunit